MIGVIDYGLGNVPAFLRSFNQLGIPVKRVKSVDDFKNVDKLVLPGVGAFDWAMDQLNRSGLRDRIDFLVCSTGMPILGVCVGLQMFFEASSEGSQAGLGYIQGNVEVIHEPSQCVRLPHMGWNVVQQTGDSVMLAGLSSRPFYFLHSFHAVPECNQFVRGTAEYGGLITAVVEAENVFGTQFHPEKSHTDGSKLLLNFAEARRRA